MEKCSRKIKDEEEMEGWSREKNRMWGTEYGRMEKGWKD